MVRFISSFVVFLLLISLTSAYQLTVNPTSVSSTLNEGQSQVISFQYTAVNSYSYDENLNIGSGTFPLTFFSSDISSVIIPANSSKNGTVQVTLSVPIPTQANTYTGNINFGTTQIPISLLVKTLQPTGSCKIYTLPIPLSKSLEMGTTASQNIEIYVSKYCTSAMTIATNTPQQQKPIKFDAISGLVEPSGKFSIQVNYDTVGVSRGTYTDSITISAIDEDEKQYSLVIPLSLTVTNSIAPITGNGSIGMPTCSINSNTFNINTEYRLICTNVDANIKIQPLMDSEFLIGVPPYVEESTGSFTYTFKPIKLGNTFFKTNYLYKDAPIGSGFSQTLNIGAGANYVATSNLVLKFYPELYKTNDGKVTLRISDSVTGAFLEGSRIYLDGIQVNNSLNLEMYKEYELIVNQDGYLPVKQKITASPNYINISINSDYFIGSVLSFNTTAKVYLNDKLITLPYTLTTEGLSTIKLTQDGYSDTYKNISVKSNMNIIESTDPTKASIDEILFVKLDNPSTLSVAFNGATINTTTNSTMISVKATEAGNYDFMSDGQVVKSYSIKNSPFYKTWWFLTLSIVLVLVVLFYLISKGGGGKPASTGMIARMPGEQ